MKKKTCNFLRSSLPKAFIYGVSILFLLVSMQCKSQAPNDQKVADNEKGRDVSMQQDTIKTESYSGDKRLLLKVEKVMDQKSPVATLHYTVAQLKTQEIIAEGTYQGLDVQWNDKTSLKLIPYIGMERKPVSENPDEVKLNGTKPQAVILKLNDSLKGNKP